MSLGWDHIRQILILGLLRIILILSTDRKSRFLRAGVRVGVRLRLLLISAMRMIYLEGFFMVQSMLIG